MIISKKLWLVGSKQLRIKIYKGGILLFFIGDLYQFILSQDLLPIKIKSIWFGHPNLLYGVKKTNLYQKREAKQFYIFYISVLLLNIDKTWRKVTKTYAHKSIRKNTFNHNHWTINFNWRRNILSAEKKLSYFLSEK